MEKQVQEYRFAETRLAQEMDELKLENEELRRELARFRLHSGQKPSKFTKGSLQNGSSKKCKL